MRLNRRNQAGKIFESIKIEILCDENNHATKAGMSPVAPTLNPPTIPKWLLCALLLSELFLQKSPIYGIM